ncbi:MAG: FecR domain-containing protein [Candidatus Eremiobacteraeota bacterium]|nr:FecR domain-containing protein [Candidatus Eremiobacteraeota bacterium]
MQLRPLDWTVIAAFFAINLGIGAYYARRGSKSLSEYFLSGRNVPWWLAGTSMVATTFAADTPLAVTGFVAKNGIAGNWVWWNMVMSGILTTFFFAALWRRSGVLTDVEFIELRYSGKPAAALRATRAVYQGVIVNTIIMGWVNLAIAKILGLTLGIQKWEAIGICLVLTAIYVAIGGMWSVLVTDLLQFVVKMTMTIVLAVAAVAAVGGIAVLRAHVVALDAAHGVTQGSLLSFVPPLSDAGWMPLTSFLVFIGVSWWASSYPGAEPGGGGYVAQRIFAAKDEKNSIMATLFFNVAHYALRPWPWILVALCALVLYPSGVRNAAGQLDPELLYVQTMVDHLPLALRGLMMAGFLAAYMSTIGTHLNLGASYMTNDLYRRFLRPGASEAHYVWVSRAATILAMILAATVTNFMDSVSGAWTYLITFTAGVGLVMILRWYWWRLNAWSEISALICSGCIATALKLTNAFAGPNQVAYTLLVTVAVTTVVWVAVTFATAPEPQATLDAFFAKVHPQTEDLRLGLRDWIAGCGLVYGALFGIGKLCLGENGAGLAFLAFAALCLYVIARDLDRRVPQLGGRAVATAALALLFVAIPTGARADSDKVLANVKGSVGYEKSGKATPLAPDATIVLADKDVAVTGSASLGRVQLPDSSTVTLASLTRVELSFFTQSQAEIANAQFVVYQGKTRFKVEHAQGAKANYTFVTPTSTVSVRGTEGDIAVDDQSLTVNVYSASEPVSVTFKDGQVKVVAAGQSLVANIVNGIVQAQVGALTQAAVDKFNELGVPTNWDSLKNQILNRVNAPSIPRPRLPF